MNTDLIHLTQFIDALKAKPLSERTEALISACVTSGGCYTVGGKVGEITLFESFGAGLTEAEAIESWIRAAERRAETLQNLTTAKAIIRRCDHHSARDVITACEYIISQTTDRTDRQAAILLLSRIDLPEAA